MKALIDPYLGALKAIAIVLLSLWLFWFGYRTGAERVQTKWNADIAERSAAENAAVFSRIKNNERLAEQQANDNQRIKKEHADEIAKIHANYATAGRLRLPSTVCSGFASAAKTESAGRGDAAAAGAIALPEQIDRDLRALMLEADEVVAGCRAAQAFIAANGMAP